MLHQVGESKPGSGKGVPLGRLGNLEVRIASSEAELAGAQAVRQQVFGDYNIGEAGEERDRYDEVCDHLIVVDEHKVVATYRLINSQAAEATGEWYSQSEFDLSGMMAANSALSFLEFGRSCVLPEYRGKRTLELLWHGSWAYVVENRHDVMFGCASFPGTNVEEHREALSFLHHHARASGGWAVSSKSPASEEFEFLPATGIDMKSALRSLPPIIKGYLRLGAKFSADPAIDHAFGTTDVLVILPVADLNPRYVGYYGANAQRHAV